MNKLLLIILIGLTLFSCNEKEKKAVSQRTFVQKSKAALIDSSLTVNQEIPKSNQTVERYFPEEKEMKRIDTIISEMNLKITIIDKALDSYVTNEFENGGIKYIDKYRDSEKRLIIKLADEVVIDTIFRKEDFVDYAGQDFLEIANLHGYWFNKTDNPTIEFFGVINKPETDWSYAFYHYFDLNTKNFKIEEHVEEGI